MQLSKSDDFLRLGSGDKNVICKYIDQIAINGFKGNYFGELSALSLKPQGRGIYLRNDGVIFVGFFCDGAISDGKYIEIWASGGFDVGEKMTNADGDMAWRETEYGPDGTSEQIG